MNELIYRSFHFYKQITGQAVTRQPEALVGTRMFQETYLYIASEQHYMQVRSS